MAIQFPHQLNLDQDLRLTNSVWDDNIAQWMTKTQTYIQTSSGVWTPLALDENGNLKASIKDSTLPIGAATSAKQDSIIGYIVTGISEALTAIQLQLDTAGLKKIIDALPAGDNNIGNVDVLTSVLPVGSSSLHELNKTLTGVAQQLSAQACKSITIQAEPGNIGYVYIGNANTVSAAVHSYILSPGGSITIQCSNTNLLWVIGTVGDKICGGGEV